VAFGFLRRRQAAAGRIAARITGFFLLALVLSLSPDIAWAHGGGVPQLTNAEAGPYWVSAWTSPDPLRVGQAYITVAVSKPTAGTVGRSEAGPPVLDAAVLVEFEPLDYDGEGLAVPATHGDAANKLFYEADLDLPETGRWGVVVSVVGPDGKGSAGFETQVSPPSGFNWMWIGGLGLIALATVWVAQRYKLQRSDE
jgi:hypothetical protein